MIDLSFGENLRRLRRKVGLTQKEIAEKLQVSRQSVSKWEQGYSLPVVTFIVPLCKVLNCTLEEIFNTTKSGKTN